MTTSQSDKSQHFVNRWYDFDQYSEFRRRKGRQIAELIKPFSANKKISTALSIGSSYCLLDEQIQRTLFPHSHYICTDIDEEALFKLDQPHLDKRLMSATDLDFSDESVDFIFAHQVLEHINEYPKILDEMARICRPSGLIYINVPNPFSPSIKKLPNGEWERPIFAKFLQHNLKKFNSDFMSNTEKYHTGFTYSYLKRAMPNFAIADLRKPRIKQELGDSRLARIATMIPNWALFIFVETNLWCLEKKPS